MKYIHIIIFLLTHDLTELKEYWQSEVIKNKDFKWRRLFRRYRKSLDMNTQYWFWWRLANEMFLYGNKKQKKIALLMNQYLIAKYNIDVELEAKIGRNIKIGHFVGIVISRNAHIGNNCFIMQNVTIGMKSLHDFEPHHLENRKITIGNNVKIGAGTFIIGDYLKIGDSVKIGAMSFINKDIPDNCTFIQKNELFVLKLNKS